MVGRIGLLVLLWLASPTLAQFPTHRLDAVYPAGGRAGETVEEHGCN